MSTANLKLGQTIGGRYEIIDVLYRGPINTVYLCRTREVTCQYALKEIWGGGAPEEEKNLSINLFDQEMKILSSITHKGIPRIIDHFSENSWHYMLMEYIEGMTLSAIKKKRFEHITIKEVVSWASQICDILNYLHSRERPIIFRDLKPSHIMLSLSGNIKLIDFGLARFFTPAKERDTYVLGTFGFAAPEQYGQSQTGPETDIYALGATLYDLLTDEDIQKFVFQFPPIRKFNRAAPSWLEGIIARCLEKNPKKRYRNVLSLKRELDKGLKKL
jgi:serine/threonine protein kinase, bacterial